MRGSYFILFIRYYEGDKTSDGQGEKYVWEM